jgi:hypothetical protein
MINDESFTYIAVNGHSEEFVRLFKTNAFAQISLETKEFVLTEVITNYFPQEMIFELLKDGCVDPMASYNGGFGNCLHLSALNGYEGIVMILLEDNRIDPSVVNNNGSNCLHLSAMNRHDGIVKLLLDDGRVDPSVVNNFGYNCLSITDKLTIKKMLIDDTRFGLLQRDDCTAHH